MAYGGEAVAAQKGEGETWGDGWSSTAGGNGERGQQHSDRANKVAAGGNVQKGHRQVGPSAQRERGISIIKIK
jgi:hypothetical protein